MDKAMTDRKMTIDTADGSFAAYVASPPQSPAPAVIVIQEIFGVNADMRAHADRLASQGYLAVVPDMFWRIEPGVEMNTWSEAEWAKAFDLYNRFDEDRGVDDLKAVIDTVRALPSSSGRVGTMGFCLGGKLAYLCACRTNADCNVSYYGVGIENNLGEAHRISKPLMLHIAESDKYVPPEAQERIKAELGRMAAVAVHIYPGCDHAFGRPTGEHYDREAAELAARRTAEFFRAHLH